MKGLWFSRIFNACGAQVNKRVLQAMASALQVSLRAKMSTAEMAAYIVDDSYGCPSPSEKRGLDRIRTIINADLESDEGNPSGQDRDDIWNALEWLARGGKRKL